jgi:hypothetical protein
VRGYLTEQLTPKIIGDLKRRCNRALASQLPTWLADHPKDVAFDLHEVPYTAKMTIPMIPIAGCVAAKPARGPRAFIDVPPPM